MFGHLQVKSAYSFQQSTILLKDLVVDAKKKNIQALTLVDNNMFGALEFSELCQIGRASCRERVCQYV